MCELVEQWLCKQFTHSSPKLLQRSAKKHLLHKFSMKVYIFKLFLFVVFVVTSLNTMVGMCCGKDLIGMVYSALFYKIWFMWLHLWNGLEKWGY